MRQILTTIERKYDFYQRKSFASWINLCYTTHIRADKRTKRKVIKNFARPLLGYNCFMDKELNHVLIDINTTVEQIKIFSTNPRIIELVDKLLPTEDGKGLLPELGRLVERDNLV